MTILTEEYVIDTQPQYRLISVTVETINLLIYKEDNTKFFIYRAGRKSDVIGIINISNNVDNKYKAFNKQLYEIIEPYVFMDL